MIFHVFYKCECGELWDETMDVVEFERCPRCGALTEPVEHEDLREPFGGSFKSVGVRGILGALDPYWVSYE